VSSKSPLLSVCSTRFNNRSFRCVLSRGLYWELYWRSSINCRCLDIPSDNRVRHEPKCLHYRAQGFRLGALYGVCVTSGATLKLLLLYCDLMEYVGQKHPLLSNDSMDTFIRHETDQHWETVHTQQKMKFWSRFLLRGPCRCWKRVGNCSLQCLTASERLDIQSLACMI
jgi:hypothetical protein